MWQDCNMFNRFYKKHIIYVRSIIEMSFGSVVLLMHTLYIFIRSHKPNSAVTILLSVEARKLNAISLQWCWQVRAPSYNSNKLTNQMQQLYSFITWRFVSLNMFQAPQRPSSGAYNCISSLWFYCWSVVVAALLIVVRTGQTTTNGRIILTRENFITLRKPDVVPLLHRKSHMV
jgi:hypothetical protein